MSAFFRRTISLIGLDIGSSAVKAVELNQTAKGYKVAAIGWEPVPHYSIIDGAIVATTFTSTSTVAPTTKLGLTYTWDFGDGTGTTTAVNPTTDTYTAAGSFIVQLTATEPGGASDTVSVTVVVAP